MAKMNIVRVILSLAVNLDWSLRQFDVKNAFLHHDMLEEVYMDHPSWFTPKEGKVCKLIKAFVWIETVTMSMVQQVELLDGVWF